MQARVMAVAGQKFGVTAAFDDASLIHDEDLVGPFDRRQTVGDDQRRPPGHDMICLLYTSRCV